MKTLDIIVDGMVVGHTTEEGIVVDTSMVIKNWWPGWISVEEKMPPDNVKVLAYGEDDYYAIASTCINYTERTEIWFKNRFQYWMPLPNPPKV